MNVEFLEDAVLIKEIISPEIIANSGQCFRFFADGAGYTGVAQKRVLHMEQNEEGHLLLYTSKEEFFTIWKEYFDLDLDYKRVLSSFCKDEILSEACNAFPGMRVLKQAPFETLISFIISANNNVKRITGIIENICKIAGEEVF